jgi:predicted unusual protein kinase regulating ubiquinone biosynthesis (AarF/ABC1/UbiB family)
MAMARKKEIKNLRTGSVSRSFSLAGLGLRAGAKAAGHAMGNLFASEAVQTLRKKAHFIEQAAMLTKELGELKGSLMKAGQMLSVYGEHFLPPEVNQLLKTLQSDSAPVEWEEMKKVLTRQLGKEKLALLEIEEEAIGAASLGQVHRARIKKTGEEIVLKVQYPGVDKAIDGDIKTLRRVLALTEWLPKLPTTDELFAEVKSMLKNELDYERERENLDFFREKLAQDPAFVLPRPIPQFSTKRVLAMSLELGSTVDSKEVAALSQERRNELARAALDLYFRELFVWQRVQTDPHFGNYRVRINKNQDQFLLYDFGAVREVPEAFMTKYRMMLRGLFYANRAEFETGAEGMGIMMASDPPELKDLFYELCAAIVEPFADNEIFDWKKNDLPQRVSKISWEIFKRFPLRAPPREVVFLDRKMAGMFTFMTVLSAKINARAVLEPYLK